MKGLRFSTVHLSDDIEFSGEKEGAQRLTTSPPKLSANEHPAEWMALAFGAAERNAGRGAREYSSPVGAQWELRRALARGDQRVRAYDGYAHTHVDRRFAPG